MASLSLAVSPATTPATTSPISSPRDRSFSDAVELPSPRPPDAAHLPRAASYSFIPHVKDSLFEESTVLELKAGIPDDEDLTPTSGGEDESEPSGSGSGDASPVPEAEEEAEGEEAEVVTTVEMNRRPSLSSKRASRLSRILNSKASRERADSSEGSESPVKPKEPEQEVEASKKSLSRLRRKSWIASSRSNSPSKTTAVKEESKHTESPTRNGWSFGAGRRKSFIGGGASDKENGNSDAKGNPRRKGTVLSKRPKRPSNVVIKGPNPGEISTSPSPRNSPIPSPRISAETAHKVPDVPSPLPKSFSSDRLPSFVTSHTSAERIPPLPRTISTERLRVPKPDIPRKKDELWSVFRELDGTYQKFQSKSIALKPNVVRSSLLPFLREYALHPSNQKLRAEDLDRRTNILNKWWTGLLDVLAGKNNQSVTGTDRYAILDGILGIMERPEWRMAPSFRPLASKGLTPPAMKSVSSTSLSSNSSDFLVESVQHNVRNIFVENILAQLIYVVDHMSLRQAPASLVAFAGKTCAYAFFFCPGIADILVRLWDPSIDNLRRVAEEAGVSRTTRLDRSSKVMMDYFPPELKSLSFVSLARTVKDLRKPAPVHLRTSSVNWHGPWLKRWSGKESDLFYVFFKHYYVLLHDFLPEEATEQERICAPGLVIVHAQILANIDATVHRHANPNGGHDDHPPMHGASPVTFDDLLDPDATAAPLPMSPANATRLMPQNRLIMLLREFLADSSAKIPYARRTFAESFSTLLKACARRISLYDSQGSHTLCDFLEEAFDLIIRYENASSPRHEVLDWPFWITVWERMAESQNTSTEIKLYSFLYTIWTKICSDEKRRYDTCMNLLLAPEFFQSRFNHWCPMVRAYYMRLICWRVGRFDGEASDHDADILARLQEGLSVVWAHFLYLRDEATASDSVLPSTAPCAPAPGRRLLIIRTDAPISPAIGPLLTFDSLGTRTQPSHFRQNALPSAQTERPSSSNSNDSDPPLEDSPPRGKWGILGKVISLTRSKPKVEQNQEKASPKVNAGSSPAAATTTPSKAASPAPMPTPAPPPQHQTFCFRFSLEWTNRNRPIKATAPNYRLEPPRLPAPALLYLQSSGRYTSTSQGEKPLGRAITTSKYAGRALAE